MLQRQARRAGVEKDQKWVVLVLTELLRKREKSKGVKWGSWGADHERGEVLVWDQGIMGGWDQGMRLMGAGRVHLLYHKT